MAKRKDNSSVRPPETLDELLIALTEHGLNFVLGEPFWQRLAEMGPDVIPALLERAGGDQPFALVDRAMERVLKAVDPDLRGHVAVFLEASLERSLPIGRRITSIKAFPHAFASDPRHQDRLISIASDPTENASVRTAACQSLTEMRPKGAQAERLISIIQTDPREWIEHPSLCSAAFLCLGRHALLVSSSLLLRHLEPILTHESARLREHAIELIGAFGDLDVIEHIFALPHAHLHQDDILRAVAAIGRRPVNLLSLRPDAFESFIARLLRHMGYRDVMVTRYSRDGGVDAICYQPRQNFAGSVQEKWIVQCKRYTNNAVDKTTIEALETALIEHRADRGLLITTSKFTRSALDYAEPRRTLELISGEQLIQRLDNLFPAGRYRLPIAT